MKRGTPYHKKMHRLAAVLEIPLPMAVGIMEMLWHHAAQHAPEGDIGSLPDVAISTAVFWPYDHDRLIKGLLASNWLERHELYRLIIHDWPDHCEQSVKKWLDRNKKTFLPVYGRCLSAGYPPDIHLTDAVQLSREAKATAKATVEVKQEKHSESSNPDENPVLIVEAVAELYRQGGVAVAQGVLDSAVRVLMGKPPATRHRLRNYVAWAFLPLDRGGGGRWPNPSKTKGLLQLLKDEEWDVDVTVRKMPKTDKERGLAG